MSILCSTWPLPSYRNNAIMGNNFGTANWMWSKKNWPGQLAYSSNLLYIPTQFHLQRLASCVRWDVLKSGRPQVGFKTSVHFIAVACPSIREIRCYICGGAAFISDHWETLFSKKQFWKSDRSWTSITRGRGLYETDSFASVPSIFASPDAPLTSTPPLIVWRCHRQDWKTCYGKLEWATQGEKSG